MSFFLISYQANAQENRITDSTKVDFQVTDSLKNVLNTPFLSIKKENTLSETITPNTNTISYYNKPQASNLIVPTALISYGVTAQFVKPIQSIDYDTRSLVTDKVSRNYKIDNYTQYLPSVGIYAFDLMGFKAKHSFADRTILLVTSHILMCATVQTIKHNAHVMRPDGSNNKSFPSGHTATAFVGAHILFKEYKDTNPWIGIGGYLVATATGAMRVVNQKHWVSDVAAGAGIGILTAEAGYLLLPSIHKVLGIKEPGKSTIAPTIVANTYGLKLSKSF
ncbi:phosphatase PAP2 family protein [Pseudopedobacter beijingensis]|uniref:Phosphatase PAP2 family protein n=1 Tax=Pseudopedobacter beijingensis TaxID=1207056 RepID=A0ABW4IAF0_9SPHI